MERHEGTPQGGPLSPLLANVLLDEVDKELEKRGHAFVRYADDGNVYVRSRRAGERVMGLLRRLFSGLRLRGNEAKSGVDKVTKRKLLGYSFWTRSGEIKRRVAPKAMRAMKDRVREITRRSRSQSIQRVAQDLRSYLLGWKNYFRVADPTSPPFPAQPDASIRLPCGRIRPQSEPLRKRRGVSLFRNSRVDPNLIQAHQISRVI